MLDLFSGLGGASQAMKDRGWQVTTVDINPKFKPDICSDIRDFIWSNGKYPVDLIWASPPCEEFSREFMPWCKTGKYPSIELIEVTIEVIKRIAPIFWIIENTKGAMRWFKPILGPPVFISNPVYLWGIFPPIEKMSLKTNKEKLSSTQRVRRALIPYKLSKAVAISIEASLFNYK
jgi:hypothetical protein